MAPLVACPAFLFWLLRAWNSLPSPTLSRFFVGGGIFFSFVYCGSLCHCFTASEYRSPIDIGGVLLLESGMYGWAPWCFWRGNFALSLLHTPGFRILSFSLYSDFKVASLLSLSLACVVLFSVVLRREPWGEFFSMSRQLGRWEISSVSSPTRVRSWTEVNDLGFTILHSIMNVPNEGNCSVFLIKTLCRSGHGPQSLAWHWAWGRLAVYERKQCFMTFIADRGGRGSFRSSTMQTKAAQQLQFCCLLPANSSSATPIHREATLAVRLSPPGALPESSDHGQHESVAGNIKCTSCPLCIGEGHPIQLHKWL